MDPALLNLLDQLAEPLVKHLDRVLLAPDPTEARRQQLRRVLMFRRHAAVKGADEGAAENARIGLALQQLGDLDGDALVFTEGVFAITNSPFDYVTIEQFEKYLAEGCPDCKKSKSQAAAAAAPAT